MHRKAFLCLLLGTAFLLSACGQGGGTAAPAAAAAETAAPENTADAADGLTLSDAAEIYAAPDAYVGQAYENLFKIYGMAADNDGAQILYAAALVRDGSQSGLTLLTFPDGAPEFAEGEIAYLYGTVQGKGMVEGDGGTADALLMQVSAYEHSLPEAGLVTRGGTWTPAAGTAAATRGTLSVDVISIDFRKDGTVLTTKTADTGAATQTTYYMDIFVHQNGYYAWYSACNYWIMPDGLPGVDNVPFPALDAGASMRVTLAPFDAQGRPVARALQIAVSPS